jgi:REP element-mobilizing transposase RayT
MRKVPFIIGQYYHIYNRGVDKRVVFKDILDLSRFFQSMEEFNTLEPIGSIFENRFKKVKDNSADVSEGKLVDFVVYCLNPNHYHFILTPLVENGIEKFMQRLGTGYTMFFNERYNRTGSLFQGKFKAVHIDSDEYLMYLNVYVNLNDKAHSLGGSTSKWVTKSSWDEYIGENKENFCNKEIVLDRFNSPMEYKEFAEESLKGIINKKEEMKAYLLED